MNIPQNKIRLEPTHDKQVVFLVYHFAVSRLRLREVLCDAQQVKMKSPAWRGLGEPVGGDFHPLRQISPEFPWTATSPHPPFVLMFVNSKAVQKEKGIQLILAGLSNTRFKTSKMKQEWQLFQKWIPLILNTKLCTFCPMAYENILTGHRCGAHMKTNTPIGMSKSSSIVTSRVLNPTKASKLQALSSSC